MNFLIDTNICIYIMNKRPPEVILKFKNKEVDKLQYQVLLFPNSSMVFQKVNIVSKT